MPTIFKLSEGCNLALHAMMILASEPEARHDTASLAQRLDASAHHLAKILQQLQRAGFVAAVRGPKGGFKLTKPASEVTLLTLYELIDGPLEVKDCLLDTPRCQGTSCCGVGRFLGRAGREFKQLLARTTLADVCQRWQP
ncbi:MAG: Rrf2 family transcriptional regulator [Lentisphaeria bacterium]|jgi:Rrf2 family nitric oxide-sensitive transcriptional repressor